MIKKINLGLLGVAIGLNMQVSVDAQTESSPEVCRRAWSFLSAQKFEAPASGDAPTVAFENQQEPGPNADANSVKLEAFSPKNVMQGWSGLAPSKSLLDAWFKASLRSAFSCKAKEEGARLPSILSFGQAAEFVKRSNGNIYAPSLYSVTYPIFDSRSNRGLVFISKWGRPLAGFNELILIELRGGAWVKVGGRLLNVS